MKRTTKLLFAAGILVSGLSVEASARPGGGSSYSGSSHSRSSGSRHSYGGSRSSYRGGGGGGGGGCGTDEALLGLALCFVFGSVALLSSGREDEAAWATAQREATPLSRKVDFRALARRDSNFSRILLEDFLFELYIRAQTARGDAAAMSALSPYLTRMARETLVSRRRRVPQQVDGVVVGRVEIIDYEECDQIVVEYESNYTETLLRGEERRRVGFYALERWTFRRSSDATSPPPSKTLAFNCPSCGAPVDCDEDEACTHCGEINEQGRYAWRCTTISLIKEETRPPTLTGYAPEVHGPTYHSPPGTQAKFDALIAKHHGGNAKPFNDRVDAVYHGLNDAWSRLQWEEARPLLTDRLWLSWRYWVRAYEEQDLRNEMRGAEVEKVVIAKIYSEPFFDVVVLRIYARAIDVTIHVPSDTVVGGDPSTPRAYSEYWTFIRPTGRDGSDGEGECPNCGAPLEVEMVGRCSACRVKVQRGGDFDWVLAKVEQDEAYRP